MSVSSAEHSQGVLRAYLLGSVPFEDALAHQRRLVFQISGDRHSGALILCEHPPIITVGRHGSRSHILFEPAELTARQWAIRWVNRGGGCTLHVPGQLAIYSIIPVDSHAVAIQAYLAKLHRVLAAVLGDFDIKAETKRERIGVWVAERMIAAVGIAVRSWVTYYGAVLNISPDLGLFRRIRTGHGGESIMTSMERERRGRVQPSRVRERVIEHFAAEFGFSRTSLFHDYPAHTRKAKPDAIATRR